VTRESSGGAEVAGSARNEQCLQRRVSQGRQTDDPLDRPDRSLTSRESVENACSELRKSASPLQVPTRDLSVEASPRSSASGSTSSLQVPTRDLSAEACCRPRGSSPSGRPSGPNAGPLRRSWQLGFEGTKDDIPSGPNAGPLRRSVYGAGVRMDKAGPLQVPTRDLSVEASATASPTSGPSSLQVPTRDLSVEATSTASRRTASLALQVPTRDLSVEAATPPRASMRSATPSGPNAGPLRRSVFASSS